MTTTPSFPKSTKTALILSGAVFPGIGQWYLKRTVKGVALVILSLVSLLGGLYAYVHTVQQVIHRKQLILTDPFITASAVLEAFQKTKTVMVLCLLVLLACWAYSIIDILISPSGGHGTPLPPSNATQWPPPHS